jgi:nitroreductase
MEFADVLARRRMVRNYLPDPVPADVLDRVARVVHRAPSAGFSQGHRLIVITDQQTRHAIAAIADEEYYAARGMAPWISRAPAHLVLGVCEDDYHRRYTEPDKLTAEGTEMTWPAPYWYVDAGALLMLVQLTAIDAGLASGFFAILQEKPLRDLLSIPDDVTVIGVITLGYAAPEDAAIHRRIKSRRKPLDAMVRWGRWNGAS